MVGKTASLGQGCVEGPPPEKPLTSAIPHIKGPIPLSYKRRSLHHDCGDALGGESDLLGVCFLSYHARSRTLVVPVRIW
jgi:hypothetical protein